MNKVVKMAVFVFLIGYRSLRQPEVVLIETDEKPIKQTRDKSLIGRKVLCIFSFAIKCSLACAFLRFFKYFKNFYYLLCVGHVVRIFFYGSKGI